MVSRNDQERLSDFVAVHSGAVNAWEGAQKAIEQAVKHIAHDPNSKPSLHGQEVRFHFFGTSCYARLVHDLERVFIEYGALPEMPDGRISRAVVHRLEFKHNGCATEESGGDLIREPDIHARVLIRFGPDLAAAYFALEREE